MSRIIKRVALLLIIFSLLISVFPLQVFGGTTNVQRDEYSRTYVNGNLSETVEIFPYSMFMQNPETSVWEQKTSIDATTGTVTYVSEGAPDVNFSKENKIVIGDDGVSQSESYIQVGQGLPSLNGGLFIGAKLRLHELNQTTDSCYYCDHYINENYHVHAIEQQWSAQDVTWSTKPLLSSLPVATKTNSVPVMGPYLVWDVSDLVHSWYQHPETNYGLGIKSSLPLSSNQRNFTKLHEKILGLPVLQVNYSPKPTKPSAISTGFQNTSQGKVDLSWSSVPGATGYRLYLYNGKEYELIYDGNATKWSSLGKNIWPTKAQIENGEWQLRKDGSGTELSDTPGTLYQLLGDQSKRKDVYYFKVSAYNSYGESSQSEISHVILPDMTPPTIPNNIKATNELVSEFTISWDASRDQSPVEYTVKVENDGGSTFFMGTTTNTSIKIPDTYLGPNQNYYVSVKASDQTYHQSNYSAFSAPVVVTARKLQDSFIKGMTSYTSSIEAGVRTPINISVENKGVETWTLAGGYELRAEGYSIVIPLSENDEIKSGQTKTFYTELPSDLPLGTNDLKWQMYHVGTGYFGEPRTMSASVADSKGPTITNLSPSSGQQVQGIVQLKGTISDYQNTSYKIGYGLGTSPTSWIIVSEGAYASELLGNWNTSNLDNGYYTLRLEAIDGSQNTTISEVDVYVANPIPAPVVDEVNDQSTTVNGTGKPNTEMVIYKNDQVIGHGFVKVDGTFSVSIPTQPAGATLKVVSFGGTVFSTAVVKTVKDVTPPSIPTVNAVNNKSSLISGKTEPNATVSVRFPAKTYTVKADTAGYFKLVIPIQNTGTAIYVKAMDSANLQSVEKKIIVARIAPNIPTVATIYNTQSQVTGKTEAYATVSVKIGTLTYSSKANQYGNFVVKIPVQNSGTSVGVTSKDSKGAESSPKVIKVLRIAPNMPVVNTVNNKAAVITGKTEKYAYITVKIGTKIYNVRADIYGNYKVIIPIQNSGVSISVVAKDSLGKMSVARAVKVTRVAPNIPTVNAVRYYSTSITGKTERYAVVSAKIGTRVYSAKANYYGNFKIIIPKQRKGTKIVVTAKDSKGRISAPRTVTVY
ncbi:hypothetical protein JOC85_003350 [Bacillus mesophilus]|uniref:Fibronectin type III domain-containing protein n=1 Tax=Bacillus mesophilus TaxID=1808955 RepID=A0A6M0Q901_9BACI|nr:Ig-like domain-containing protein [Bacillus mesophilus]MBM7662543.1 hypothetical protein [Bacillus mesophilus]NEY72834.1 fibronectin type III domain-containing protein [Bacillus mesophilus]